MISASPLPGFIPPDGQPVNLFIEYFGDYTSSAFVYYTITDNSSNDPRVFLPQKTSDLQIDVSTRSCIDDLFSGRAFVVSYDR